MVPSLGQGANRAFEDAYVLSQCLAYAPSIAAALKAYEKRRLPRTQVIYVRSAFVGNRSYEADSETYSRHFLEKAEVGDAEFEEWLYNYKPLPAKLISNQPQSTP